MAKPQRNKLGSGGDPNTIYIATTSGSSQDPVTGEVFSYTKGVTRVRGGHVLLKLNESAFEPIDDAIHYDIEQATKGPGERRRSRLVRPRSFSATPEEIAAASSSTDAGTDGAGASAPGPGAGSDEAEGSRGIRLADLGR